MQDELGHAAEESVISHCCLLHLCPIPPPPDSASVSERHIVTFCFQEELSQSAQRKTKMSAGTSGQWEPGRLAQLPIQNGAHWGCKCVEEQPAGPLHPQKFNLESKSTIGMEFATCSDQVNSKTMKAKVGTLLARRATAPSPLLTTTVQWMHWCCMKSPST